MWLMHIMASNLGFLIDVDGFELNRVFLVKELAIGYFKSARIELYSYKVGDYSLLTSAQQRQVSWLTRHIHGLEFDSKDDEHPQSRVADHILDVCRKAEQSNTLIGYKGGHFELDLLREAGYEHLGFNIEQLAYPKLESLFAEYPYAHRESCPNHKGVVEKLKRFTIAHCPRMEVYCFMRYTMRLILNNPD
nr:hypothetical protein NFEMFJFI_00006 [Oryctes rhinoceros nudivirus]